MKGIKTVEGRRGDPNSYRQYIGKVSLFYNRNRSVEVIITAVRHYATLYEYLDAEGYNKVLPGVSSYQEAVDIYHGFYSDDDIARRGGMVALQVKLKY